MDREEQIAHLRLIRTPNIGPMTFSLAKPLNSGEFDEEEVFQFTLGRGF